MALQKRFGDACRSAEIAVDLKRRVRIEKAGQRGIREQRTEVGIGLFALAEAAGAEVVGCAIAIEKGFQSGGDELRKKGVRVESLAIIESMESDSLTFRR